MPDFDNDLLLITCASGKQATALLPHIIPKWKHVRLQVLSTASKERLEKAYPSAEVICADMADSHACHQLLKNTTSVFLVGPPFHPHESTLCTNILDAALTQPTTPYILYTSVLHPILRKLLNHDIKRYTEEYLIESSLPYTIIQPTTMMENLPLAHLMSSPEPIYPANWSPATKFSFVSTLDIAEAAYKILCAPEKHRYATYQLVSTPEPLSYNEAMAIVSEEIGKEVKIVPRSLEEAADRGVKMVAGGRDVTQGMKDVGVRMFLYYDDRGLLGNSGVLEWLLGKKPRDYRTWVREKVKEIRGKEEGGK